jgi:uncharacterized protein YjbJ (UPF0337 family)
MDKAKGRAKEAIGKAIGNKRLEREGKRDQVVGAVKDTAEKVRDKVERKIDEAVHPEDYEDDRGANHG